MFKTANIADSVRHPSPKSYNLMEYYFRVAVTINAIPFTYDKRQRQFSFTYSSLKFYIWVVLMFTGILAETAQVTRELVRAKMDKSVNRGEWALIAFIFCSWTFVIGCHFSVLQRSNLLVNHINQTVTLRNWFTESRLPHSTDHKFVAAHIMSSCMQCVFQCLLVATEGTKAHFLYSLVPEEQRSPITMGLWALYATYRVTSNFLCGYFHYFAGALHVQTCRQILELRMKGKEDFRVNLLYYRMVQALCNRYSEGHSGCFIPFITRFATDNMILGIYGTVKFYDKMDFDKYVNFPLMVVMIFVFIFSFYPRYATLFETTKNEQRQMMKRGLEMHAKSVWKAPEVRKIDTEFHLEGPDGVVMINFRSEGKTRTAHKVNEEKEVDLLKEIKSIARSCPIIGINFGSLYKIRGQRS